MMHLKNLYRLLQDNNKPYMFKKMSIASFHELFLKIIIRLYVSTSIVAK